MMSTFIVNTPSSTRFMFRKLAEKVTRREIREKEGGELREAEDVRSTNI